ncbi:uncharacterized protein [Musca autumnalis]|uniref:uncharacterized protein n=1 Tax=Musca autumnalis TaxID=221902 RepID=UPI003CECF47A
MFKFVAFFALLAVAAAAPGLVTETHHVVQPVVTKTAYVDHSASSAITHQSFTNLERKVPVVHTVAAAPVVKTVATPVVHTYAAAPVVTAPVVHTYAAAPVVKAVGTPVVHTYAAAPVVHTAPLVKTVVSAPVAYTAFH